MGLNTTRRRFVQLAALSATAALGSSATAAPSHGTVQIKTDPAEKLRLRDEMTRGFYGGKADA